MAALLRHLSENNKLIFPSPPLLQSKKKTAPMMWPLRRPIPLWAPFARRSSVFPNSGKIRRPSFRPRDRQSIVFRTRPPLRSSSASARAPRNSTGGRRPRRRCLAARAHLRLAQRRRRRQSLQWGRAAGDRDGGKGQCCRMAVRPAKLSRPPVLRDKQPFTLWTLD